MPEFPGEILWNVLDFSLEVLMEAKRSGFGPVYEFGPFRLDVSERVLSRGGRAVTLPPKAFDTLVALVERRGRLVERDELLGLVWPDVSVEDGNLSSNVSIVRRALGDDTAEPQYIETIPKRGYRFVAPVNELIRDDPAEPTGSPVLHRPGTQPHAVRRRLWVATALFLLIASLISVYFWRTGKALQVERVEVKSPADEAAIKRVLRDSQVYETLTLYVDPSKFDPSKLNEYWLPEERGGREIVEVRASVRRLFQEGRRYGPESRLERFDFTYVKVYAPGDYAEAGTIERWYLPLYQGGKIVPDRNVFLGPYSVDYTLRKVSGRWLIERTTTPRAQNKD